MVRVTKLKQAHGSPEEKEERQDRSIWVRSNAQQYDNNYFHITWPTSNDINHCINSKAAQMGERMQTIVVEQKLTIGCDHEYLFSRKFSTVLPNMMYR